MHGLVWDVQRNEDMAVDEANGKTGSAPELTTPTPSAATTVEKTVYWRRELPPLAERIVGEQTVEAESQRVPHTSHEDELWERGAAELEAEASRRIEQELRRVGGSCAHVVEEQVEPKVDYAAGTTWLSGRYTYVVYRH